MDCKHTRLLCPWDYPGKNAGVGSHSLPGISWPRVQTRISITACRFLKVRASRRLYTNLTHFVSSENLSSEDDGQTQLCAVNWLFLVDFVPCVSLFSALSLLLWTFFLLLYISLISSVLYPFLFDFFMSICVHIYIYIYYSCYNFGKFRGRMEKAIATHSSTLAWKIPWTEEPGRLQSMGSLGVGHNWASSLSLFTFMHWRRKWQPTPVFLAWWIPGTGEPGGLPSTGSHRVGHDWSDLAAAAAARGEDCTQGAECVWNSGHMNDGKGSDYHHSCLKHLLTKINPTVWHQRQKAQKSQGNKCQVNCGEMIMRAENNRNVHFVIPIQGRLVSLEILMTGISRHVRGKMR